MKYPIERLNLIHSKVGDKPFRSRDIPELSVNECHRLFVRGWLDKVKVQRFGTNLYVMWKLSEMSLRYIKENSWLNTPQAENVMRFIK